MNKFLSMVIISLCVFGSGCDVDQIRNRLEKTKAVTENVSDSMEQAEPLIALLEDSTGRTITPEDANKIITILNNTKNITEKAQAGAAVLNFIPGAQPYVRAVGQAIGLVGLIATSLGAFFQRRKTQATKKALASVILGVNNLAGAGKAITDMARVEGCADFVESAYKNVIPKAMQKS